MNTHSSLVAELRDKTYREAHVASQIELGLPLQVRALRRSRGWTQEQFAKALGMSQPRVAEIEKPGRRRFNLETLLRIAAAFDVALEVRFVSFSKLIQHEERFDPEHYDVPSFETELVAATTEARVHDTRRDPIANFLSTYLAAMTYVQSTQPQRGGFHFNIPAEARWQPSGEMALAGHLDLKDLSVLFTFTDKVREQALPRPQRVHSSTLSNTATGASQSQNPPIAPAVGPSHGSA